MNDSTLKITVPVFPIYKPKTIIAEFETELGEKRIIHRLKGKTQGALRILNPSNSPSLRLNRVAAQLIGMRIRAKRLERGMTLEQLGTRAGLKGNPVKVYVFAIEQARRHDGIRFGTLYAIALALSCDVSELMPDPQEVATLAGVDFGATISLT